MSYDNLYIIFGTIGDKDVGPVLTLLPNTAQYIWTKANIPKGDVKNYCMEWRKKLVWRSLFAICLYMAISSIYAMKKTKMTLIFGNRSIFIVGDALKILE